LDWTVSAFQSPAVDVLKVAVDHRTGGVLVFWAPFNTGKTYAFKDMVKTMQSENRAAIYLDAAVVKDLKCSSFMDWLKVSLDIPEDVMFKDNYKANGGNRTIIVIDHFEDLLDFQDTSTIVVNLGRISFDKLTDHFRIVLAVSRSSVALQTVDWNGREKIRLACAPQSARWTNVSHMSVYARTTPSVKVLPVNQREEVIRMACEGGSAGLVEHLANEHESVRQIRLDAAKSSRLKGIEDLRDLTYFPRIVPEHQEFSQSTTVCQVLKCVV
jgi:hypothetical protein